MDELLQIMIAFGGGKGGGPNDDIVRFLLPAMFWAVLTLIASREWHREKKLRDLQVALAAMLGLGRELLMFTAEFGSISGLVSFDFMFRFYPPLAHAATMLSCIMIAFAFLRQVRVHRRFNFWYLRIATASTIVIYLFTAIGWQRFLALHPGSPFGSYTGDMILRITASLNMAVALIALYSARRRGRFVPKLLFTSIFFFFLDEFLMVVDLATHEQHVVLLSPIRHNLHIWAIPLLIGTYWIELRHRIQEAGDFAYGVIDALSAHICVLDEEGTIIAINRAWRQANSSKTPVGDQLKEGDNYLAACEAAGAEHPVAIPLMTGILEVIIGQREEFFLEYPIREAVSTGWFNVQVTRFPKMPLRLVIAHEDITERKLAEIEALSQGMQLLTLNRVSEICANVENLQDAFQTIAAEIGLATRYPAIVIELYDEARQVTIIKGCSGIDEQNLGFEIPVELSLSGKIARSGEPYCEFQATARPEELAEPLRSLSLQTVVCVPMISNDKVVGTLSLGNPKEIIVNERFVHWVTSLANTVAAMVERKRAEESLRTSEERYRQLYDAMGQGMALLQIICDDQGRPTDGLFLEVNPSYERIVGLRKEEILGKTIVQLFPGLEEYWMETYGRVALTGEASTYENYAQALDRYFQVYAYSPKQGQFAVLVSDVTEKRRNEQERCQLEEQMQHAQKLESLGILAGGVAHDFNNILMAILGNTELAVMRLGPDSPARDNLRKIELSAQRAAELARQMLAYSGKGRFVVAAVDLGKVVTEMTDMLEVSISKKVALTYDLALNLPLVEADVTQLRQVVMNLVINASEAIGDQHGVISIATGSGFCDRAVLAETWLGQQLDEGEYVHVEVADTGCGMDKETMSRIFDPFFTTKFTGRGLGMAAVLGIVRGHKGTIKVTSQPGEGAHFKVFLPAVNRVDREADHQTRQPASEPAEQPWQGSGLVLLVDDESSIRSLGTEMLQNLGFQVLIAADGNEAVRIYREREKEIDCVLLDLTMPEMDGEEAFRLLRQIRSDSRVILSSGYSEQEINQRFPGRQLNGFIQKPYKIEELATVLQQALQT